MPACIRSTGPILNPRPRILVLSAFQAPFIQDDIEILSTECDVRALIGHGVLHILKIVINIPRTDIVVCWFGSVYAFVGVFAGKLFGKRSMIILGGVDVANDAELGYGIWLSSWRSKLVRYALRHAHRVVAGEQSMKERACRLAGYGGGNIIVIPPGFDPEYWKPSGEKEQSVLTVAALNSDQRLKVKGIDTLIEAARILPNMRFVLIGMEEKMNAVLSPPENMTVLGPMERGAILEYYRRARIYCQPSRHEAVGYSLREAMLCGCIPVVSDVGGMPTAAGGIGILVPPGNIEALVVGLQQATKLPLSTSARARAHIVALCPKESRRTHFLREIQGLAG